MSIIPHYFKKELFYQFVKSSELVMVYINIFLSIIYGESKSLFLTFLIIFGSYFNYFLKHYISVPIFNIFNDYIPIFGQGSRPKGASDCGYFTNCPATISKSFGFPSGHSQFAGIYSGFLIRDIIYSKTKNGKFSSLKSKDKFSVIFLVLLVFIMMFARIYIEKCHTIEQTVFGASIGFFLGYKSHYLYLYINKKYNNILNIDTLPKKLVISAVFFYLTFLA